MATGSKSTQGGGYSFGAGGTTAAGGSVFAKPTYSSVYSLTTSDAAIPVVVGTVNTTLGQAVSGLEYLPAAQWNALQAQLADAGFLKPGSEGDPVSVTDAYIAALRTASIMPSKNLNDAIALGQALNKGKNVAGTAGVKVTADLTNPMDVAYTANAVAQKYIGRSLRPDEVQAIAADMRAQEMSNAQARLSQEQSITAAGTGTGTGAGGIIANTAAPTVDAETLAYLSSQRPGEFQGHELLGAFQAFDQKVKQDAADTGAPKAAPGPVRVI